MTKSGDSPISKLGVFSKNMPPIPVLLLILFIISVGTGIISLALISSTIAFPPSSAVIEGILTGILVIMLPTLLTVLVLKSLKRHVKVRYLIFVAMLATIVYCIALLIGSAAFALTGNFSIATAIVLVGDASIYGWWFFVSKVMLGLKKQAIPYAMIQPVINILIYAAASTFIFTFSTGPLGLLLVKLFAGILVFLVISYMILYMFDSPIKRTLGFGGIDAFSEMIQNWLFDVDLTVASSGKFGFPTDIDVHTLVFRRKDGTIKTIFFAPWLHYGPVGTLGGSNFPFLLEKYSEAKYKAPALIMHTAVNEDNNPVSSSQIAALKKVFDKAVKDGKKITDGRNEITFVKKTHNGANVSMFSINKVSIAIFTRAPKVTEDIHPAARRIFKEILERDGNEVIMIDAHNSRYESAPEMELDGVKAGSKFANDYIDAIKSKGGNRHVSKKLMMGVANLDVFGKLEDPIDIAPGNLNVVVFKFNGFKYAIVQVNANNILPSFRTAVVDSIMKEYGIEAEICTTDTHYVNNVRNNASNVLGRQTSAAALFPFIEKGIDMALSSMESVDVYYKKEIIPKFRIWGPGVREKAFATINSVVSIAKILVPAIVAAGFIIASWLIFLI